MEKHSKRFRIHFVWACIAFNLFTACGSDKHHPKQNEPGPQAQKEAGNFEKRALQLLSRGDAAPCLLENKTGLIALSQYMDLKRSEIIAFREKNPSQNVRLETLGPLTVKVTLTGNTTPPGEWQEYTSDWQTVVEDFQTVVDKPISSESFWVYSQLSTLLETAENSSKSPEWAATLELNRLARTHLKEIRKKAFKGCTQEYCDPPSAPSVFTAEELLVLDTHPLLKELTHQILLAKDSSDRKTAEDLFNNRYADFLLTDEEDRAYRKNKTASFSGETFTMTLHSGFLSGVEDTLKKYFEEIWSRSGYRLNIRWATEDVLEGAYRFIFLPEAFGRSFVSRKKRTINISDHVRKKTIAHEVGHAMGLEDEYYESFRPDICQYREEYDLSNIMSDTTYGEVNASHWEKLKELYR